MAKAFQLEMYPSFQQISAQEWDACAGEENPFMRHAFLLSMEESGTACCESGWAPQPLVVRANGGGPALGVLPLYGKSHSQGEFVFDYAWADAYQRAGGQYYPKLQVAVPYTPVPGPRLATLPGPSQEEIIRLWPQILHGAMESQNVSGLHVTFCTEDEFNRFGTQPEWLQRTGVQFHWFNRGYTSFDDFLATLSARKRKNIKKERAEVQRQGLVMEAVTGDALREHHWDAFYQFYLDTCGRKWGGAYLTRRFFSLLGERMCHSVVLMLAREGQRYVAGALNLLGPQAIYGRNWGCLGHYPFLHFELCYYQAIDFAIAHGLKRVEAGAQGTHKIARGYEPITTYSLHYIRNEGFRSVLRRVLEQERAHVEQDRQDLSEMLPFRTNLSRGEEEE